MSKKLESLLQSALGKCKYVGDIGGRGLFQKVESAADWKSKETFEVGLEFGLRAPLAAFERGKKILLDEGSSK